MTFVCCQFCKKPCRVAHDTKRGHAYNKHYRCDYHGAVVVKHFPPFEEGGFHTTILSVLYRDNTYECRFTYPGNSSLDTFESKFRIDKMNHPPKTVETIVSLDFHPEITPENIAAKLPTYLLFS